MRQDSLRSVDAETLASPEFLPDDILPDQLGFQLRRAQIQIFAHFKNWFGPDDPNPNQFGLLVLISRCEGLSQIELSRLMGVERATIGEALVRMEAHGWIHRTASKADRRSNVMSVSPAGQAVLASMLPRIAAHEADFTRRLTAAEQQTLMVLLGKLTNRSACVG